MIVKETYCDVQRITELIRKSIPEVCVNQNVGAELTYLLPSDKSHFFQQIFEELEQNRRVLGISSYGASVTTMEEVRCNWLISLLLYFTFTKKMLSSNLGQYFSPIFVRFSSVWVKLTQAITK